MATKKKLTGKISMCAEFTLDEVVEEVTRNASSEDIIALVKALSDNAEESHVDIELTKYFVTKTLSYL